MSDSPPQLSVVMPVFQEAEVIATVVKKWSETLDELGIDYEFLAYNDGSRDNSLEELLREAESIPRLEVINQSNRGHGPTILRGYLEAQGDWIFQTDSDNELPADSFAALWAERQRHDFLIGVRQNRESPLARRIVTRFAGWTVRLLFGRGITDLNCPYRLMPRPWVREHSARLPSDTFAPNVILSGLAVRQGLRVFEHPVPHRPRRTGTVSIANWKLWRAAFKSFRQTVAATRKHRASS